ncbi:arginine-ornithine antiporter [Philodulcilactobacillus myokoensis]|uniref:Arginine-ornithine antiporter n=1 Tax=Philodulcilactobacillus myokoensis TaxID=2929573 RepID=A0A9W6ESQ1_9LACO|nr:basic amino acid/polyamine antiporter [Philodulcilactobacillus myokoensis]GLB47286.1 arginine-ornithine antiporter [Philodulcilactobacillus myokoensis]
MEANSDKKLNLLELTGLVVGSIIGGGIFNLMHDMALGAGAGATILGWIVTAIGMMSLAFTFQNLTIKRADLNTGIYSYAEEGFGKYMGFNAAWGYWLSVLMGNVSYATLVMSSIGYFIPIFGNGQNIYSIIGSSVLLWGCHFLLLKGVKSASFTNVIITITKLVMIALFILIAFLSFKLHIFTHDFWYTPSGHFELLDVLKQVKSTMLVTVWVFVGIEGAVIFSGQAKHRRDVGRATVFGISIIILIYMLITLLSFGVMSRYHLAHLGQPAMAYFLQDVVGKWGAVVVNIGLIIAVMGTWMSFTMLAGQVPYEAAKAGTFPKSFAKANANGAPTHSLLVTDLLVQILLFLLLFAASAYNFFFSIASSAMLVPYALTSFYQLKHSIMENHGSDKVRNIILGIVASIYSCWLLFSIGTNFALLMMILFAAGIPVYWQLQRKDNHQQRVFKTPERILAIVVSIFAIFAIYEVMTGKITF